MGGGGGGGRFLRGALTSLRRKIQFSANLQLQQLTHAMSRYHWNIVGLCEMRWKNFGEMSTDDGHKVYFSGEEDRNEYGV